MRQIVAWGLLVLVVTLMAGCAQQGGSQSEPAEAEPAAEPAAVEVTTEIARRHLQSLGIDTDGLTPEDRKYFQVLRERGGPVSLGNMSRMCGLDSAALRRDVEPWLIQKGWVGVASCGRFLTQTGKAFAAGRGF